MSSAFDSKQARTEAGMKVQAVRAPFAARGGVHPPYGKDATASLPVETLPLPKRLVVSLAQHLGAPSKPTVKKGDKVLKGEVIAEAGGFVSSSVHAPTSGTVKTVDEMMTATGRPATCVEIEADGADASVDFSPLLNWNELPSKALVNRIAGAGIIGMGGAGFPTHVKLSPPPGKTIDTLIINGAECEPRLTADHRLMVEQPGRILAGARIIKRILGVKCVWIAIEDNKPEAIASMEKIAGEAGSEDNVRIVALPTLYPQGAEKQLICSITGREVPSGGLPMDVGALVENVGTAAAIADAILEGKPLIERIVTVTGDGVRSSKNFLARVGTPLHDLVAAAGGLVNDAAKIISGGPMMGIALEGLEAGLNKTTSGLVILRSNDVCYFSSMPCIACGRCVEACPMGLMPCTISERVEAEDYVGAEGFDVLDCIECGCCAYECPAHRPLVQHMRLGKAQAMARRKREATKSA